MLNSINLWASNLMLDRDPNIVHMALRNKSFHYEPHFWLFANDENSSFLKLKKKISTTDRPVCHVRNDGSVDDITAVIRGRVGVRISLTRISSLTPLLARRRQEVTERFLGRLSREFSWRRQICDDIWHRHFQSNDARGHSSPLWKGMSRLLIFVQRCDLHICGQLLYKSTMKAVIKASLITTWTYISTFFIHITIVSYP